MKKKLRKVFEKPAIKQTFGLALVLAVFSLSVLAPETLALVNTIQVTSVSPSKDVSFETATETTFRYPLENFALSQGFSWYHWGIDLTVSEGTAVYPITKGKVLEVGNSLLGFGNYILINHQNGQRSLYAHLKTQEVKAGDEVERQTTIGQVGHTGWATGNHLHLEIYQKGLPLNPLEVLPEN